MALERAIQAQPRNMGMHASTMVVFLPHLSIIGPAMGTDKKAPRGTREPTQSASLSDIGPGTELVFACNWVMAGLDHPKDRPMLKAPVAAPILDIT